MIEADRETPSEAVVAAPTEPSSGNVEADPPRPLPNRQLIVAGVLLAGVFYGVVVGLSRALAWPEAQTQAVLVGGFTSMASVAISLVALKPWRARPAADWSLYWLGSATIRTLFTPLALFSVYSATLLPGPAVLLGGAAAFFAALVVETSVIARAVLLASASGRGASGTSPRSVRPDRGDFGGR